MLHCEGCAGFLLGKERTKVQVETYPHAVELCSLIGEGDLVYHQQMLRYDLIDQEKGAVELKKEQCI